MKDKEEGYGRGGYKYIGARYLRGRELGGDGGRVFERKEAKRRWNQDI